MELTSGLLMVIGGVAGSILCVILLVAVNRMYKKKKAQVLEEIEHEQ